ncbi:MAG: hypothetical protein ACK4IX_17635, partial [Candidatus Sericytochromatia bacterium]
MSELNGLSSNIPLQQTTTSTNQINTATNTTSNDNVLQRNLLDSDAVKMSNIASSAVAGGIGAGLATKIPKASFEMETQSVKDYVH